MEPGGAGVSRRIRLETRQVRGATGAGTDAVGAVIHFWLPPARIAMNPAVTTQRQMQESAPRVTRSPIASATRPTG